MELKISDAKRILRKLVEVREVPVLLNGGSGVGKTSIVKEIAEELKMPLLDFRLSSETPENIGGVPIPDENGNEEEPNEKQVLEYFVKIVNKSLKPVFKGGAILFFDELNRSSGWVRNAVMSVFFERTLAGRELDERTVVLGAINTGKSYRDTEKLDYALLARFAIINIKPDFELAHTYVRNRQRDEIDDEYDMLFLTKRPMLENVFYLKNDYTPIEPAYTGRNVELGREVYRKYRKDHDLRILMKCILPDDVVDLALSGFDLRKVDMILNGDYNFEIEKEEDALTLISLCLMRRDITEHQVLNVIGFIKLFIDKVGMKDAVAGILREFGVRNQAALGSTLRHFIREFPWIKDIFIQQQDMMGRQ